MIFSISCITDANDDFTAANTLGGGGNDVPSSCSRVLLRELEDLVDESDSADEVCYFSLSAAEGFIARSS